MRIAALVLIGCLTVAAAQAAPQPGRPVRVGFGGLEQINHQGQPPGVVSPIETGDIIPFQFVRTLLFLDAPCPLNIVGASRMRRAWVDQGADQLGCWFPLMNGYYVVIDGSGRMFQERFPYRAYPRAELNPDDSVTITQPHYNATTFLDQFLRKQDAEMIQKMARSERP